MDRKEEIIIATLELAVEKGLGAVSMAQIADKVGIKKASLYNHFKSKEEIMDQMYVFLRNRAKARQGQNNMDLGALVEGKTMKEVLYFVVDSYQKMNADPQMNKFYKVIMAERGINPKATKIMVEETQTMINATKMLFYTLQAKKLAHFTNPDASAITFAMAVHSIMDYELDLIQLGQSDQGKMMNDFIEEFCDSNG